MERSTTGQWLWRREAPAWRGRPQPEPLRNPGRAKLDTVALVVLNRRMETSRRASIESQLAGLAKRQEEVRGELAEQAEKIAARAHRGKPATARMLTRLEEMRAAYASIQRRHELLRAKQPLAPVQDDEF